MAANPWLLGHLATKYGCQPLLAPHAPCASPDLITSAQNGFHFLWIGHLIINYSKWLPILDCLAIWLLKMAANLLILGLLAPHAPWSSPDLITSAQNGFHFLWIAHLTINCSKWLTIHFYLAILLHMLLGPIQTWSQNGCLCHLDCKTRASKAFVHTQMGFCKT